MTSSDNNRPGEVERETWATFAAALASIKGGERPEGMPQSLVVGLIANDLIRNETTYKPCKCCGTSRPDYSFWRVSAAGNLLIAALTQQESRNAE